jgi:hypothetical protein
VYYYHHYIMRTTVDIDTPIMKDLKKIRQKEGKSLGRIMSDLLAQALREQKSGKAPTKAPKWISKRMGARIDLADREALYAAIESDLPLNRSSKSR